MWPVDIDQCSLLTIFAYGCYPHQYINQLSTVRHISSDGIYLPRELFNMVHIRFINFSHLIGYRIWLYQNLRDRKAINHNMCKWSNLVNLEVASGLMRHTCITKNKNIISILIKEF